MRCEEVAVRLGERRVLDGVTVDVAGGEIVGLVGPNGAGKSTLLRAISGLVPLEGGRIEIEGAAHDRLSSRELARRIAVVQQLPEAPPSMRVGELVLLGRSPHLGLLEREGERDRAIAWAAMERAGCADLADRALSTLSGGQRRRAFIARALAQDTKTLLLDEPTSNLDPQAQGELFALLRTLADEGTAVLAVVHDLTLAAAYCDRVVLLAEGRVVAGGAPAEVLTASTVARVYGPLVDVVAHPETGLPLVVPATVRTDAEVEARG
ncbi:MAG: ABC transporter ATP-binding protein [Dehalococcoidia bacterium]